jgi:dipeptide transport system ATP-binding protein
MEQRSAHDIFELPQHPYTEALMAAMPERSDGQLRLATIPGMVPGLFDRPTGCLFAPRCTYAANHCRAQRPSLRDWQSGMVRCHYPLEAVPLTPELAA